MTEQATAIAVPAPTTWPLVLAIGVTLTFAGLLMNVSVSVLGAVLSLAGGIGWFRELVPRDSEEDLLIVADDDEVRTERRVVDRLAIAPEQVRAWLPVHTYPISAGVKGGLAGSVAMAFLAMLYGVLSHTSIWYPINLLAAGFFPAAVTATTSEIAAFHLRVFLIAVPIHLITSLVVGLLYGATLPMMPRRPILMGGVIAPLVWSGLLYRVLDIINPVLNQHIDWRWFVLSQLAFGMVAGIVVSLNQGQVGALNAEAQKLFTTLTPVIPMN